MTQKNSELTKQFFSLHQTISENIRFTKRRQWMLAYYVLTADAGMIALHKNYGNLFGSNNPEAINFTILYILIPASIIYLAGIYILMDIQKSLFIDRFRLINMEHKLPQQIRKILNPRGLNQKKRISFSIDFCPYNFSFIFVMSIGLLYIFVCSLHREKQIIVFGVLIIEIVVICYWYTVFKKKAMTSAGLSNNQGLLADEQR